jgi:hypothetical protein
MTKYLSKYDPQFNAPVFKFLYCTSSQRKPLDHNWITPCNGLRVPKRIKTLMYIAGGLAVIGAIHYYATLEDARITVVISENPWTSTSCSKLRRELKVAIEAY